MVVLLRNSLNEDEYHAFKRLFLTFNIQKEDVVNFDIENIKKKFNKQYRELSLKYHPDKNSNNKKAEESFKLIASSKPFFEEFIIEPLEKGLGKRNNLMKELRGKLWNYSYTGLQKYLNNKGRNELFSKQQSINNNILTYFKYSSYLFLLGGTLLFLSSIAFFISNGVTYNVPIALGFFVPLLVSFIWGFTISVIYAKNGKEPNQNTRALLLFDFDQECENFSESDRTKLRWLKNLFILSSIICISLMFYGVGLDLVANGFGITNSVLLSGLLLVLLNTLLIATSPALNAVVDYICKKTAINSIEEQFKGDGPLMGVDEEQPSSTISPDSTRNCFADKRREQTV